MKRARFNAEAELNVLLRSRKEVNAIAAALGPESIHSAKGRGNARVTLRGHRLKIVLAARDSPSLRAIMSSYLRMLKATTTVCASLLELERTQGKREAL